MSQKEKKVSETKIADKKEKQHKHQKHLMIGTIIILVFTIISFVLVPALAGSGGASGSLVFGRYNGKAIQFQQGNYFSQQVESVNSMYRDSMGTDGNIDFLRQLIWRSAFNQTVVRTAILDEVEEAGISISSRNLDRGLVDSGMFNENGSFSEQAYMNTSATRLKELRSSLEEDLMVQAYYSETISNHKRSEAMMDFLLDMGSPEKNFSYARLPYSEFPADQVKAYGNDNIALFEEISLSRITIRSSEDDAASVLQKLDAGEKSFEDLAKTYSKDSFAENGGSMGNTSKFTLLTFLSEDQASEVMGLSSGKHSGLVATDNSWYIFQADSASSTPDMNNDAEIAKVRAYMEREEVGIIEDYLLDQAGKLALAAHNSSLEEAALEFGAESGETGFIAPVFGAVPFIINSPGNKRDSAILSAAAYSDEFFDKTFILKSEGETSQPMVLDRSVVVFALKGEQEGFSYPEEYMGYIKQQLAGELSQYKQSELQGLFLDSPKLKDMFSETYGKIFAES